MNADANRAAKAELIATALARRGMGLADLAPLPYAARTKTPTVLAFVRRAYAEGGSCGLNPPHDRTSRRPT